MHVRKKKTKYTHTTNSGRTSSSSYGPNEGAPSFCHTTQAAYSDSNIAMAVSSFPSADCNACLTIDSLKPISISREMAPLTAGRPPLPLRDAGAIGAAAGTAAATGARAAGIGVGADPEDVPAPVVTVPAREDDGRAYNSVHSFAVRLNSGRFDLYMVATTASCGSSGSVLRDGTCVWDGWMDWRMRRSDQTQNQPYFLSPSRHHQGC